MVSQCPPVKEQYSRGVVSRDLVPFGSSESERVGELSSQCGPELGALFLWHLNKGVVVSLKLLVGLIDLVVGDAVVAVVATSTPTTTSFASSTTTASTLRRSVTVLLHPIEAEKGHLLFFRRVP